MYKLFDDTASAHPAVKEAMLMLYASPLWKELSDENTMNLGFFDHWVGNISNAHGDANLSITFKTPKRGTVIFKVLASAVRSADGNSGTWDITSATLTTVDDMVVHELSPVPAELRSEVAEVLTEPLVSFRTFTLGAMVILPGAIFYWWNRRTSSQVFDKLLVFFKIMVYYFPLFCFSMFPNILCCDRASCAWFETRSKSTVTLLVFWENLSSSLKTLNPVIIFGKTQLLCRCVLWEASTKAMFTCKLSRIQTHSSG